MRYLLLLITIPAILFSQYSWERSPAQEVVDDAINHLYNYHFDTSLALLDSAKSVDNTHPLTPFLKIAVKFLDSQVEENYDLSYDRIYIEVARAIPTYKDLIKLYPNDAEYLLYLGSSYGLRARVSLGREDWLGVLYNGYQGLKYIKKAQELDPNLMDIYMPIGLMEYASCLSPSSIQWFSSWVGLSSDCDLGIEYIQQAVDESRYSYIEASNILTYIYMHLNRDYNHAEKVITPLVNAFPRHPYFIFLYGELLARNGNWDKLDSLLPELKEFTKEGPLLQRKECELKLQYILALYRFDEGRYTDVISLTTSIIDNYQMEFPWLEGFTYLLRGKTYDILGQRSEAKSDYKNVLEMDYFYKEVKEAEIYLESAFSLSR